MKLARRAASSRTTPKLAATARRGFALLTVLLVLLALLVLCAPFLMTARNTSKAGTQLADRAQARLALDSAVRNARARLSQSHAALDPTPYYDDAEELYTVDPLDPAFLNDRNDRGVMFSAEVEDVAARIDLNSASPGMFANLLGVTTRTVEPLKAEGTELIVSSTYGFAPVGFLWLDDELIGYSEIEPQKFKKLVRGIGGRTDAEGAAIPCGPQPAKEHPLNSLVIDQRAFAPVLWRNTTSDGAARVFDAPEQLRDCVQLALGVDAAADYAAEQRFKEDERLDLAALRAEERHAAREAYIEPFLRFGSTYAGVRAGREWQRPVRVLNGVEAGKTCRLEVDEVRWFAPGSTVRITDGRTTELAIVQRIQDGALLLVDVLANDYFLGTAQLQVQARRPVNINTASAQVLELLFANLQVRGVNDRITRDEARALAEVLIESRPFIGFEDFVRRLVLPAAALEPLSKDAPVAPDIFVQGGKVIDEWDAVALLANALNSNDSMLAYSTMPFAFSSRDVFEISARAVVNAPSGVERVTALRDQVELVAPQRDLMQLWARQEDFDDAARLDLEAPWWTTGPSATARRDGYFPRINLPPGPQGTATPPSRLLSLLGVHSQILFGGAGGTGSTITGATATVDPTTLPTGAVVAPSREEDGYAALWPSRAPDSIGTALRNVMHFDHETRDPEGRYLPDETIVKDVSGTDVNWVNTTGQSRLLGAFNFSMWIKPRQLTAGQTLLDVGRTSLETDRVQLFFDGTDLVLRVLDGAGDNTSTAFREAGEVRYALAPNGQSPGLLEQSWAHVAIDVRGNRPSQMSMLVDGRSIGVRTPGLSRLVGALPSTATTITVENGEGFGEINDPVVLRIGNELIEAVRTGANTFDASWETGGNSGFGGRLARVPFDLATTQGEPGAAESGILTATQASHASGTPVELYGYAAALASNVPSAQSVISGSLGVWTVGRATAVVGGQSSSGDIIQSTQLFFPFGTGIDGSSSATAIEIQPVDIGVTQTQLMAAFNPGGGYAAIVQKPISVATYDNGPQTQTVSGPVTNSGAPITGVEIVRYTSVSGNQLNLAQRASLKAIEAQVVAHAFVIDWNPNWKNAADVPLRDLLDWQVFVVPISLPVTGGTGLAGFPLPTPGESEFAQIGDRNTTVANTEWVRYDDVQSAQLVRHDKASLEALEEALTHRSSTEDIRATAPPGGNGGNPGQIGIFDPSAPSAPLALTSTTPTTAAAASVPQSQAGSPNWQAYWGVAEDSNWPVTRAARSAFQFRGVFGTHTHTHTNGTSILPVWRVPDAGMNIGTNTNTVIPEYDNGRSLNSGIPGRLDTIFVMESSTGALGWPHRIHRSFRPYQHIVHTWARGAGALEAAADVSTATFEDLEIQRRTGIYVALDEKASAPVAFGTGTAQQSSVNPILDSRQFGRVMKHPSGERPREVDSVYVGSNVRGAEVASVVVDELAYGATLFGGAVGTAQQGGNFVLATDLPLGSSSFTVQTNMLRLALGDNISANNPLTALPSDAGLLRIGDEIVCYDSVDPTTGVFTIPTNGRALLGTVEATHEVGENAVFLDAFAVSVLTASISAEDSSIPLNDLNGFPFQGTLLIGDELLHYTRIAGGALEMPRRSSEPGKMDARAGGVFRGRYGTTASGHQIGDVAILFPFRYWDRWSDRADAPELAYFGFAVDQPNAFFKSSFYIQEEPQSGAARVEVLQRLVNRGRPAPPWDGDPQTTEGLTLLGEGMDRGDGHKIGAQADLIEWRAHVRYAPGAFDAQTGLSHGWKQTPRLKVFGVEYLAPGMVLRRIGE